MSGYTKLFSSLLDSSVWESDLPTKVVWVTMLAMADRDGLVEAAVPGLARRAGVTRAQCQKALKLFLSPDKHSRTPDHEGRRIAPADGGWKILNHAKYRERASQEEAREKAAERQRQWRERHKNTPKTAIVTVRNAPSRRVTRSDASNDKAEAEAHTEAKAKTHTPARHDRCPTGTKPACDKGVCVPVFLADQWVSQMQGDRSYITAFVTKTSDTLSGPVSEDPLAFWRGAWKAAHVKRQPKSASTAETFTEMRDRLAREKVAR